jgi:4-hydroxy 2-oxovalerate aldolase
MINASELINHKDGMIAALERLFSPAEDSPVDLVRVACHFDEFESVLPASQWLKQQGYSVGFNLMQISERSLAEIRKLAETVSGYPLDVLYFADSLGSMDKDTIENVVGALRTGWEGDLGIHTHDNMSKALANSISALDINVTWVDGTVLGMGRGPGNVKTEYLALEVESRRDSKCNITPLLGLIHKSFGPLKDQYKWGSNPYYYLAGKYAIHPSYIQEMLSDSRYSEEDLLVVIDHLKRDGGKKYNPTTLEAARHFFIGEPRGAWDPSELIDAKDVLIIGSGPGASSHQEGLELYIRQKSPIVIALNTQKAVSDDLIDIRAACHPIRLLADCEEHLVLPQPLATPATMLPTDVKESLGVKQLLDYGLSVQPGVFEFHPDYCILPTSLVIAYALAIATSGKANQILLAGFDGYGADDPRRQETDNIFRLYESSEGAKPISAITPTLYEIPSTSVYALIA